MICVAANDQKSLESVARWSYEIQDFKPTKPTALILTKADLLDSVDDPVNTVMIKCKQKEMGL